MSTGWFWFCVAILSAVAAFLVGLALFWGREFGRIGYVYWLTAAALPLVGIAALSLTVSIG